MLGEGFHYPPVELSVDPKRPGCLERSCIGDVHDQGGPPPADLQHVEAWGIAAVWFVGG